MSFAEKVGSGSGDVFGIRIPVVVASAAANGNVMKKLFESHDAETVESKRYDLAMKFAKKVIDAQPAAVVAVAATEKS